MQETSHVHHVHVSGELTIYSLVWIQRTSDIMDVFNSTQKSVVTKFYCTTTTTTATTTTTTTTVFYSSLDFVLDYPGEPVLER